MGCFNSKSATAPAMGGSGGKAVKAEGFSQSNFIFDNVGKVQDFYAMDKKLGQGTYGSVSKGKNKKTNQIRAVKSISKTSAQVKNLERFKLEIEIMKGLDHPNIIKLFETFEDHRNIYLILELCQGGELFDRILADGHFNEAAAANLMKQILGTIYYLHENGVMHRDLKPENFLFVEEKAPIVESTLKIIDFGLSTRFNKGDMKSTKAGTPYYVSPQVLQGKYDESCDVWSCGIIMYIMLCGYPPFYGENDTDVLARVRLGNFTFEKADWANVSVDATELIKNMLKKDVSQRFTAEQSFRDIWIQNEAPKAQAVALGDSILKNLQNFKSGNKLKKAALHVIATHMDEKQIKDLRQLWLQLDANGDGSLTLEEMQEGLVKLQKDGDSSGLAEQLKAIMDEIDTDGSGKIDYTEFLAATLDKKQYMKEDVCWAAFRVFDRDGNGVISKQELHAVLNDQSVEALVGKEMIEKIMNDADANGDGEIDFEEFMAMMSAD